MPTIVSGIRRLKTAIPASKQSNENGCVPENKNDPLVDLLNMYEPNSSDTNFSAEEKKALAMVYAWQARQIVPQQNGDASFAKALARQYAKRVTFLINIIQDENGNHQDYATLTNEQKELLFDGLAAILSNTTCNEKKCHNNNHDNCHSELLDTWAKNMSLIKMVENQGRLEQGTSSSICSKAFTVIMYLLSNCYRSELKKYGLDYLKPARSCNNI